MDWFNFIKENYKDGFYIDKDVYEFVELKKITQEECKEILEGSSGNNESDNQISKLQEQLNATQELLNELVIQNMSQNI